MKNEYIYTIKFKLLEDIVNGYIDYVTNPQNIYRQDLTNINMFTGEEIYNDGKGITDRPLSSHIDIDGNEIIDIYNLPTPQQLQTKYIFMALLHNLYNRFISTEPINDEAWFLLSSEALKKIDDNYAHKINYLLFRQIISKQQYDEKRCLYTICKPEVFHLYECPYPEVHRKIEQIHNHFEGIIDNSIFELQPHFTYPHDFFNKYNKSIKHLELVDVEGAISVANSQQPKKDTTINIPQLYYTNIIEILNNKTYKRVSPDANGRLYHIGTRLPNNLKKYTNIKLSIDCKNSHLLLFNNLLLSYYLSPSLININNYFNLSINNNLFNLFYIILFDLFNYPYHYFVDKPCNYLKDKGLENNVLAKIEKIPQDVWHYMYYSGRGMLWDYFIDYFKDDEELKALGTEKERRNFVKKSMFGNVFYDARTRINKVNRSTGDENPNSKWALAFREKYPNVFKIINHYKKELKRQCEDEARKKIKIKNGKKKEVPEVQLSHLMMRLESQIFTSILVRLFKKRGLHVMGIHDAIVVLEGLDKCPESKIREIMIEEYAKFGLVPTLSVDVY